ncbi:MAG: hypothetical protein OEW00_01510 [candidate division Zixibacteria bacterium]|nr:hypothetical protein [candidate division Zixibacteria bacterium]
MSPYFWYTSDARFRNHGNGGSRQLSAPDWAVLKAIGKAEHILVTDFHITDRQVHFLFSELVRIHGIKKGVFWPDSCSGAISENYNGLTILGLTVY